MEQVALRARTRDVGKGAARRLRREGFIPAVVYGQDKESIPLQVDAAEFARILRSGAGRNSIIRLEIEGEDKTESKTAMIKEVQWDVLKGGVLHADLYLISMKDKLETSVPIHIVGEEEARKSGGVLQYWLRQVEIKCLPTRIPDFIEVDVSNFKVGDQLEVGSLDLGEGIEVLTDPKEVIVSMVAPKVVEERAVEPAEGAEGQEAETETAAPEAAGEDTGTAE